MTYILLFLFFIDFYNFVIFMIVMNDLGFSFLEMYTREL